ncbi:MAG: YggT family protein [Armatimonadota bacterium]
MLVNPLVLVVNILADAFYVVLLVRVVFSWVQPRRMHPLLGRLERICFTLTEPVLRPIRGLLFRYQSGSPIDFSPLVAWVLVEVARRLLTTALRSL